jgi:hypothetical protein
VSVYSNSKRFNVGPYRFVVFADSGKYRLEAEHMWGVWFDEAYAREWFENLKLLKCYPPLFPEDRKRLADAERWLQTKGGEA